MNESVWMYFFMLIGILGIVLINIFGNVIVINEQNYYLLKEVTRAAMIDSVDIKSYEEGTGWDGVTSETDPESMHCEAGIPGTIRIVKEKFVESFTRRFAEAAGLNRKYKIVIHDIDECPPKVSISLASTEEFSFVSFFDVGEEDSHEEIVNSITGILEATYVEKNVSPIIPSYVEPTLYTINYNLNGGSHGANSPSSASVGSNVTISNPSKRGYDFTGWTSDKNAGLGSNAKAGGQAWTGSKTKEILFNSLRSDSGTVTLTANWEGNGDPEPIEDNYTIVYRLSGGSCSNCPTSAKFDEVVSISNPTRSGYLFVGWSSSFSAGLKKHAMVYEGNNWSEWLGLRTKSEQFKGLRDVSGNVTLTANWQIDNKNVSRLNTYTIKYNLNGGTSGARAPVTGNVGESIKISHPTRSGYTFTGWTSSFNDGLESGAMVDGAVWKGAITKGTLFKNLRKLSGEVTLTANWQEVVVPPPAPETYTIKYELDGGTKGTNAPESATVGETVEISHPTRSGYTFTGWTSGTKKGLGINSMAGGSKWSGALTTETLFKDLRSMNGIVTLTANWKKDVPKKIFTLTYSCGEYGGGYAYSISPGSVSCDATNSGFCKIKIDVSPSKCQQINLDNHDVVDGKYWLLPYSFSSHHLWPSNVYDRFTSNSNRIYDFGDIITLKSDVKLTAEYPLPKSNDTIIYDDDDFTPGNNGKEPVSNYDCSLRIDCSQNTNPGACTVDTPGCTGVNPDGTCYERC